MILCGDVLDTLGGMPDGAFDSCLCDPPYGLRFMGRLLVPFAGVGSEMIGALLAGWEAVVGIENDLRHCAIGRRRIGAATSPEFVLRQPVKLREVAGPLFEDLDP